MNYVRLSTIMKKKEKKRKKRLNLQYNYCDYGNTEQTPT